MSDWRKESFKAIIDHAALIMSNRICSDTPEEIRELIPKEDRVRLSKDYEDFNSGGKDFDGQDSATGQDWILLFALWNATEIKIQSLEAQIKERDEALIDFDDASLTSDIVFEVTKKHQSLINEIKESGK